MFVFDSVQVYFIKRVSAKVCPSHRQTTGVTIYSCPFICTASFRCLPYWPLCSLVVMSSIDLIKRNISRGYFRPYG